MANDGQLFELKGPGTDAVGYPTEQGFVVVAGSLARRETVPSVDRFPIVRREELIQLGTLVLSDNQYRLEEDVTFRTPSGAAKVMLGRHANGWQEWKLPDGRTLSEVRRAKPPTQLLTRAKRDQISAKYDELLSEGRILPVEVLRARYDLFRSRFGPEIVRDRDGEALLNLIHDHTDKESLVYWLEFKNDEDFDTKRFGSIAGGSALKYRVFRRRETGLWNASDGSNRPVETTLERAVEIARGHKEQLLRGVDLLDALPDDASADDYAGLQDRMDEEAPDVSGLAWGHKYFSMLFPEKLDDYHSPRWQRFHLRKLLVEPPEGDGRYVCGWYFIQAAREAELHPTQLATCLNQLHGSRHRYWRVGTRSEDKQSQWPHMRDGSFIATGWEKLDDLSWVAATKESRQRLKEELSRAHPNNPSTTGRSATELTNFIAVASEGDIVWAADGATILGVGRISGEYRYDPSFDFPHQRPVDWLSLEEWKMPVKEALMSTFREIKRHAANIVETERRIQNAGPIAQAPTTAKPKSNKTPRLSGIPGRIQSTLERKGQVILYGPPGTGKTYWAERTARDLAAYRAFGEPFDALDEDQKKQIAIGKRAFVQMCCFHPAYGYEDFLEGYRPIANDGQVAFELRDGIFKNVCTDAEDARDRDFFLIIDEINRGDIPRIFGELLTTIEKDKRDRQIVLPVSQRAFTIPQNVFLIGTMNTADRSISLLDAALRRRFGFVEMMPDPSVLAGASVGHIPLAAWISEINNRIREHVGRDARNLQLGHSYLMHQGAPLKSLTALRRAIRDDVIPLLEEYCYENYATLEKILGNEIVDLDNQRIRYEIFEAHREDELTKALWSAEMAASPEAISSEGSSDDDPDEENNDDNEDAGEGSAE